MSQSKILLFLVLMIGCGIDAANAQRIDQLNALLAANYRMLEEGTDAAKRGDCASSMSILSSAANESVFSSHPEMVRRVVYRNLVACANRLARYQSAIPYIEAAIALGGSEKSGWLQQLIAMHIVLAQPLEAVDGVVRLAEHDSRALNDLDMNVLGELHGLLNARDVSSSTKFTFLRTLHDANLTPVNPFETTDELMIDYAIMLSDRGETSDLKSIVRGISDPGILVRVLVDKRFEVVASDPEMEEFLDLESAAEREIERLTELVDLHPEYAIGAYHLSRALTAVWRFEEALEAIEPTAGKVRIPFNLAGFADIDSAKPWVLAEYSAALWRLEYPEQSGAMYQEAAEAPEADSQNVSQVINVLPKGLYGGFLRETHDIARGVDLTHASLYGKMWVHAALVCVNVMGPQMSDYSISESYLSEHERDNPAALPLSLLCKNDLPGAGQQMIGRLDDPGLRMNALLYMQYTGTEWEKNRLQHEHADTEDLTPGHILWHRFDELRNRGDVLQAVNRVGRLLTVPLHQTAWHQY